MINPANTTNSSSASWGRAGISIAFGLLTVATASLLTDMPEGGRGDLLVLVAISSAAIGLGSVATGYQDTQQQSNRNLVGMIFGGVAIVVFINVVSSAGEQVAAEVLGYVPFGTIFIGGFLAAGGAFLGFLGLRLGHRLTGMSKEERRG